MILIGQRSRPPGSDECSQILMEFTTIGIDSQAMMTAIGMRKKMPPNTSSQACCFGVILLKNTSTRTCSSCLSA